MFIFNKEMAEKLRKIRETARLTQKEVALRIGIKTKSGRSVIGQLESGRVKNPTLRTILEYLRACGASWPEFFKQLDTIDFKIRHENLFACGHAQAEMIAQVQPPPTERKIQRDAMKYEINIEFPSKEKEEIDFERLKKQFKDKVLVLLNRNQIGEKEINSYQKFALEYFDFLATLNKPGIKMVTDKYQRAGLKLNLLVKIKRVINSVLRGEIKRIEGKSRYPPKSKKRWRLDLLSIG
jgi:transcriptional regulator with XRE-family HTH domain